MCLIINKPHPKPKTATEDIVCYKVVEPKTSIVNGAIKYQALVTPFKHHPVDYGVLYEDAIQGDFSYGYTPSYMSTVGMYKVESGGYHLFRNKEDAEMFNDEMQHKRHRSSVIVKAVIPKGTLYVEGLFWWTDNCMPESVVTKKVIYHPIEWDETTETKNE